MLFFFFFHPSFTFHLDNRHYAATIMNHASSRSHTLFLYMLKQFFFLDDLIFFFFKGRKLRRISFYVKKIFLFLFLKIAYNQKTQKNSLNLKTTILKIIK